MSTFGSSNCFSIASLRTRCSSCPLFAHRSKIHSSHASSFKMPSKVNFFRHMILSSSSDGREFHLFSIIFCLKWRDSYPMRRLSLLTQIVRARSGLLVPLREHFVAWRTLPDFLRHFHHLCRLSCMSQLHHKHWNDHCSFEH